MLCVPLPSERVKGVETIEFTWELYPDKEELSTVRYCTNCNKKVPFYDSLKRRHNANGKDIYEYAIYKCERGHTWNKLLKTYKAIADEIGFVEPAAEKKMKADIISVSHLSEKGVGSISILLQEVEGRWRLDKVLANQIEDVSRAQIEKMILQGTIMVDGEISKPSAVLKSNQRITVAVIGPAS